MGFMTIVFITIGFPILLFPIMMINKSDRFYKIAEKENRLRKLNERTPAPVEEDYKMDATILSIMLSILLLIM
jgi:hypothetical protein